MSSWQSACVEIGFKDFASICRVCFAKNNLRNLQEVEYLVDVLQSLTDTEIVENDGLPQNICVNCIKKLEDISDFIDLSKYNDTVLRQVYLTQFNLKTNTVIWASENDVKDNENTEVETKEETISENTATSDNSNSDNTFLNLITCEPEIIEEEGENEKEKSHDEHTTESDGSSYRENDLKRKSHHVRCTLVGYNAEYVRHRREQNRKAAAKSRKKFRDQVANLMKTTEYLERANSFLKKQKHDLEAESIGLVEVLSKFKCSKQHVVKVKKEKKIT